MITRQVKEGRLVQGVDEAIAYTITTTPWGSSPGTIVVAAYNITEGARTDVTSTVFPAGSASASGDIITLALLRSLTAGNLYRIEVKFTCSSNIFEAFFEVQAET